MEVKFYRRAISYSECMTQVESFFDKIRDLLAEAGCAVDTHSSTDRVIYVVKVNGAATYRLNIPHQKDADVASSFWHAYLHWRFLGPRKFLEPKKQDKTLERALFCTDPPTYRDLCTSRLKLNCADQFLSGAAISVTPAPDGEVTLRRALPASFGFLPFEEELISDHPALFHAKLIECLPATVNVSGDADENCLYSSYPNVLLLLSHVFPNIVKKYEVFGFEDLQADKFLPGKDVVGLGSVLAREIEVMDHLSTKWRIAKILCDPEVLPKMKLLHEGRILNSFFRDHLLSCGYDPDILDYEDAEDPPCMADMVRSVLEETCQSINMRWGVPIFSEPEFKMPSFMPQQYRDMTALGPPQRSDKRFGRGWASKSIPHAVWVMITQGRVFSEGDEIIRSYRELLSEVAELVR